ncbi:MAG: BatD family protein [Nitrospinales bacterium]
MTCLITRVTTGSNWNSMRKVNIFRAISFHGIILATCLIIFTALSAYAEDVSVTASVDKTELTLEDSATLSIIVKGLKDIDPIPLPPIDGFKVHSRGKSSAVQIINGDMYSLTRFTYRLIPTKTGTIEIDSIKVRLDGKNYSTEPITLTVKEAVGSILKSETPAYVQAIVSNEQPYINEEVTFTIRLFQRVNAQILDLEIDLKGFRQEDLGKPKRYKRVINGVEYLVTDISSALFPIKTGTIEIPPAILEVELRYQERGKASNDPFDIFNNGPFSNRRIRTEHKALRTRPIYLKVQPLPEKNKPENFTNLIGQFNLSANLSKTEIDVGDTSTLTIKIFGQGNINDVKFDLPDLSDQFKVYPDKPEFKQWVQNNRISGQKTYSFALVPLKEGIKTIPPFSLNFFDPLKKDYFTQSSKPHQLTVSPSKSGESFKVVESETQMKSPSVKILGEDIFPIHTKLSDFESNDIDNSQLIVYAIILIVPGLMFIGLAYLNRHRDQLRNNSALARSRIALKQANQQLDKLTSSQTDDQKFLASELSRILREYLGNKLNLQGNAFTSDEVETKLKGNVFKEDQVLKTQKLLEKYESMQFSPNANLKQEKLIDESKDILLQLEKQI